MRAGPVTKVNVACPQCGERRADVLWSGHEHEYDTTDELFTFVRCSSCGLVRLNPRPDVSELRRIYPPDYYAYNLVSDGGGEPSSLTDRMKMRMYQRRLEALVERRGTSRGTIRLLDVGCADGRLLDWYRQSAVGERIETHGIELNEEAAAIARQRGHRVVSGRFELDTALEAGSFDLILALHVIEHVAQPKRFVERASELLAPGGVLVLATPNWDSVDSRRFRGHWGGNHFPRHWTLYDRATIGELARSVGLELERVEYQPNPIFWVWSMHSLLSSRFPGRRWPDRLFQPVGIFKSTPLSFVLQSCFTVLDLALRRLTGRTGSIAAELGKPG